MIMSSMGDVNSHRRGQARDHKPSRPPWGTLIAIGTSSWRPKTQPILLGM